MKGKNTGNKAAPSKGDDKTMTGAHKRSANMRPLPLSPKGSSHRTPTQGSKQPPKPPTDEEVTDSENIKKILTKLDGLDNKIESTKVHLSKRIDNNNAKTDKVTEDCAKVKVESAGLKAQMSVHGIRLSELEAKIEQFEREKRRTTLIIDGVEDLEDEDTAEIVEEIFKDIGVDYNTRVGINLHRRGGKKKGRQQRRTVRLVHDL